MKKTFNLKSVAAMLLSAAALCGCSDEPGTGNENSGEYVVEPMVSISLSRSEAEVAKSTREFAFNFLRETMNSIDGQNILVSPFSMSSCWAMLANGAKGATLEEIKSVLGFEDKDMEDVNNFYGKMFGAFPSHDSTTDFQLANGFFHVNGNVPNQEFISVLQDSYDADIIGFEECMSTVNNWVKEKTNQKIDTLITYERPYTFLTANALYFNGKWSPGNGFNKSDTKEGAFHNYNGSSSSAQFMNQEFKGYAYYGESAHMIKKNFGNGAYQACFILPNEGVSISAYVASLDANKFASFDAKYMNVKLSLPKFETETNYQDDTLGDILVACGFEEALTGMSDFSGIYPEDAHVNSAAQACSFMIDEDGATAAAASLVGYDIGSPGVIEPEGDLELTFDRPFVYLLTETSTNTILMAGVVRKL